MQGGKGKAVVFGMVEHGGEQCAIGKALADCCTARARTNTC